MSEFQISERVTETALRVEKGIWRAEIVQTEFGETTVAFDTIGDWHGEAHWQLTRAEFEALMLVLDRARDLLDDVTPPPAVLIQTEA